MRSKSTIYIAIVFALILVVSVGYALFSENIKISGTAKAEGTFDVDIMECTAGVPSSVATKLNIDTSYEGYYRNDSCTVAQDKKSASPHVDFYAPEGVRYFYIKLKNNGTVNAALKLDGGLIYEYKACIDGHSNATNSFVPENYDGVMNESDECMTGELDMGAQTLISHTGQEGGYLFSSFANMSGATIYDSNGNDVTEDASRVTESEYILYPEDELVIVIESSANKAYLDRITGNRFNQTAEGTYRFNFEQPTVQ